MRTSHRKLSILPDNCWQQGSPPANGPNAWLTTYRELPQYSGGNSRANRVTSALRFLVHCAALFRHNIAGAFAELVAAEKHEFFDFVRAWHETDERGEDPGDLLSLVPVSNIEKPR